MEPNRQPDNGPFLRHQTFLRLIADVIWSRLLPTWDASVGRSHARERRSYKPIRTNGLGRLETQAMATTEGNCCEPKPPSRAMPPRLLFPSPTSCRVWTDCLAIRLLLPTCSRRPALGSLSAARSMTWWTRPL